MVPVVDTIRITLQVVQVVAFHRGCSEHLQLKLQGLLVVLGGVYFSFIGDQEVSSTFVELVHRVNVKVSEVMVVVLLVVQTKCIKSRFVLGLLNKLFNVKLSFINVFQLRNKFDFVES